MTDRKQKVTNTEISLDELVAMVEQAAAKIIRLQEEVARQNRQIKELEQQQEAARQDADWSRWFRQKYRNTVYYPVIEKAYFEDHPQHATVDEQRPAEY
jgi:endonuclease/exonuclease/phosphatase family metal-dependent hydrolase